MDLISPRLFARLEDWPERLIAYLDAQEKTTFRWGTTDCVMFVCNGVLELTGVDPIPQYRKSKNGVGTYTTERGAVMALKRRDGTLPALMTRRFGPSVDWKHARRGDIVLLEKEDVSSTPIGLCVGQSSVFRSPISGLVHVETSGVSSAWRVGD